MKYLWALSAAMIALVPAQGADKLMPEDRVEIIRGLTAEYGTVKAFLPRSKKPLPYNHDGTYDKKHWEEAGREMGPAARVGDLVQITKVEIESDKILLEINGGVKSGRKWYERIEVGMGQRTSPIGQGGNPTAGTNIASAVSQRSATARSERVQEDARTGSRFREAQRDGELHRIAAAGGASSDQREARRRRNGQGTSDHGGGQAAEQISRDQGRYGARGLDLRTAAWPDHVRDLRREQGRESEGVICGAGWVYGGTAEAAVDRVHACHAPLADGRDSQRRGERYKLPGDEIESLHRRNFEQEVPDLRCDLSGFDQTSREPLRSASLARSTSASTIAGWPSSGGVTTISTPGWMREISSAIRGRSR